MHNFETASYFDLIVLWLTRGLLKLFKNTKVLKICGKITCVATLDKTYKIRRKIRKSIQCPVLLGQNMANTMYSRVAGKWAKTMQEGLFFLLYNLCLLTGRDGVLLQHGHSRHTVLTQETCPHYFQHYTASVFFNNLKKFVRNGKERVSSTIF